GSVVVTIGPHGAFTVWRAADGRPILDLGVGDPLFVSWSVSRDGRFLALDDHGALRLWDLRARRRLHAPALAAASVAFAPDARTLAIASGGRIVFWDAARGRPGRRPLRSTTRVGGSLVFSPDGRRLAIVGRGRVDLWNLALAAPRP